MPLRKIALEQLIQMEGMHHHKNDGYQNKGVKEVFFFLTNSFKHVLSDPSTLNFEKLLKTQLVKYVEIC
ncbi:MAG: hypothetical protein EBV06_17350 [Planctomycetia bacterium]|nr:hypothetical protein [Planctomycetia bacterium]